MKKNIELKMEDYHFSIIKKNKLIFIYVRCEDKDGHLKQDNPVQFVKQVTLNKKIVTKRYLKHFLQEYAINYLVDENNKIIDKEIEESIRKDEREKIINKIKEFYFLSPLGRDMIIQEIING